MERNIKKSSLKIFTRLPQICKPNEFMVAFFIINTMAIEGNDRIKMYRGKLADLCNMSERNISRLTDSLNQLGIIQKELIGDAEKKKTYNYYRLNWEKIEEFSARIGEENESFLPELSGLKKKRIKEFKEKKEYKEINEIKEVNKTNNKLNNKREFEIICEASIEEPSVDDFDYTSMNDDFKKECENAVENTLIPNETKIIKEPSVC